MICLTPSFVICLGVLFLLLLPLSFARRNRYGLTAWQVVLILIVLVGVVGVGGSKLFARISFGSWFGRKFYGSVFVAPFVLMIMSLILRKRLWEVPDFVAPLGGVCNMVMKIPCFFDGCSFGIVLYQAGSQVIRFPSNVFEMCICIVTVVYFLNLEKKHGEETQDLRFPMYMIIYGATRYFAGWLRGDPAELNPYLFWIPAQRVWPFVDMLLGIVLLCLVCYKKYGKMITVREFVSVFKGKTPYCSTIERSER